MMNSALERNLPGLPSQRLRRTGRKPVVKAKPGSDRPKAHRAEIPVSDTYADGRPCR